MTRKEQQERKNKRDNEIIHAANNFMSFPDKEIPMKEFTDYSDEEVIHLEFLLRAATLNVFFKGEGNRQQLFWAVEIITNYRRNKFGTSSVYTSFFEMTKEGKELIEKLEKIQETKE